MINAEISTNSRRVAVWDSPGNLILKESEIPSLKNGEVLLKVEACAICGSDLRILKHGNPRVASGQIVGHEISGTICKVAGSNSAWKVGDRVAVGADVPCGNCVYCNSGKPNCCDTNFAIGHQFEGGFTDYMVLNQLTLEQGPVRILANTTDFDSAALAEPLACCINGYERGFMASIQSVVIFGAGPIGMMLGMLAKSYKASNIILIDPNEMRLRKAIEIGAAVQTLNPATCDVVESVMALTGGRGGDMIFTACPVVEVHEQAIKMVAKRGVVNLFGGLPASSRNVALQSNLIHYREAYITGSHGSTPSQHAKAVELIESGEIPVDRLITHRMSLEDINNAYKVASSGEGIKVIIKPQIGLQK